MWVFVGILIGAVIAFAVGLGLTLSAGPLLEHSDDDPIRQDDAVRRGLIGCTVWFIALLAGGASLLALAVLGMTGATW